MAKREWREWAATRARYQLDDDGEPYAPESPDGDGWRLVSALSTEVGNALGVVWYWERDVEEYE